MKDKKETRTWSGKPAASAKREGSLEESVMKKKRRLPKEILMIFLLSSLAAVIAYFFFRSTAGTYTWDYLEAKQIVLTEFQQMDVDFLIAGSSLVFAVLIFLMAFLLLLGKKLSYLQEILDGVDTLRIHREKDKISKGDGSKRKEYSIPIKGNNEFTDLAKSINYLSETERKLSEKEEELRKERELLTRALSHDIRTPLTTIRSYSEMMEKKVNEENVSQEELRDYLEIMIRKADQMKELTGQLLENCKHNPEFIEDGRLFMEQLLWDFEEQLEDHFEVNMDISRCPAFSAEIDVREFQRIFDNLYSNIIKYADDRASVELTVHEKEGRLCIFQKNKKKKEISYVESHQIGLLSIKSIAGNYGGRVSIMQDEEQYTIEILLLELAERKRC